MNPFVLLGLGLGGAAVAAAVTGPRRARAITSAEAAALPSIKGRRVVATVTAAQASTLPRLTATRMQLMTGGGGDANASHDSGDDDEDDKSKAQQATEMTAYNAAYEYCEEKLGAGGEECGKFAAAVVEKGWDWAEENLSDAWDSLKDSWDDSGLNPSNWDF